MDSTNSTLVDPGSEQLIWYKVIFEQSYVLGDGVEQASASHAVDDGCVKLRARQAQLATYTALLRRWRQKQ